MNKPTKQIKTFLDYFEIKDYILKIYNYEKDEDKTWDFMCDTLEVRNDSYSYIPTRLNNTFTNAVKEEFGEDPEVWISW
jgi:hypothetical protein